MSVRSLARAGLALGAGIFAYASLIERNRFGVRYESIDVLEPSARSIRVLHLSDIHLAPWQQRKIEWVRGLAEQRPDLIVITGDTLGHADAFDAVRTMLEPFRGVPGVFVHGSNDYFAPRIPNPFTYLWRPSTVNEDGTPIDTDSLDAIYRDLGWINLDNASSALTINGSLLTFTGTDDPHLGRDRADQVARTLDEQLDAQEGQLGTLIGVTHAPYRRVLDLLTTLGSAVIFAGHTHGGQVCLPGIGALTTNSDLPLHLARGLGVWNRFDNHSFLNVSAGIGTSIYAPVRFACPPEAVLVELNAGDFGYA